MINEKFCIAPQNAGENSEVQVICTATGRMTSMLRHVAQTFPSAKQETILNNHQVIGIATNGVKLRLSALYKILLQEEVTILLVVYQLM